jgi:predicted nucleic acid-binding protein
MILLDTTILVYAVGSDHPLREPCRMVIAAVGDGRLAATTTVEALQEFAHVSARRRGRTDAATQAALYATLLAPLVTVDADDLTQGLRLFREHERLGAFDAVLAAAALRREHIRGILSADRAFGAVSELEHIDPADPQLGRRLAI